MHWNITDMLVSPTTGTAFCAGAKYAGAVCYYMV